MRVALQGFISALAFATWCYALAFGAAMGRVAYDCSKTELSLTDPIVVAVVAAGAATYLVPELIVSSALVLTVRRFFRVIPPAVAAAVSPALVVTSVLAFSLVTHHPHPSVCTAP